MEEQKLPQEITADNNKNTVLPIAIIIAVATVITIIASIFGIVFFSQTP